MAKTTPTTTRKKPAKPLAPGDVRNLSFVKDVKGEERNFWATVSTGDYAKDCELGHLLADEYIAFVARFPTNGNVILLGWIVEAMMKRPDDGHGLRIGFLHTVNSYAIAASCLRREVKAA